jgi:hypothetical protein
MSNAFGTARKRNDWFAGQQVVQKFDGMTRTFRPGNHAHICEGEITGQIVERVRRNPDNRVGDPELGRELFVFVFASLGNQRTND